MLHFDTSFPIEAAYDLHQQCAKVVVCQMFWAADITGVEWSGVEWSGVEFGNLAPVV